MSSNLSFTFLGTGTSAGVPMIGCNCAVCTSTDPRDKRLRTSGCMRWTDASEQARTMLIDAGPDLRVQSLRARLHRCDSILFTHNHVDHCFGLDEVRRFNAVQHAPIDVHADEHTLASLRTTYQHIFARERNVNDSFVASLIPWTIASIEVERGTPFKVHGLSVMALRLLHGRLPVLGYRFDATPDSPLRSSPILPLAYCTDLSAMPPETLSRLSGLSTLVLDCLRERSHPTHLKLTDAVSLAAAIDARQTFFVHMSHELGHEETNQRLPEGMQLAHDGLTIS